MAGELLLLFLQFFLLSALSHDDSVRLPVDCLDFDLDDLDDYLSSLNLTEVPSVESMVAGFQCPITALPFGSLKSDWSRLLLLYEATDFELKEKLKRLFRILVIVFHRWQERLVPTKGHDTSTIAGQFSTVSYSITTTRDEVIKNSTNFVEGGGSTTDTNTKLHESDTKDSVTSLDDWISTSDNVSVTQFYSTAGSLKNESSKLYEKLTTSVIMVENNQTTVSDIPDRSASNLFTATQDNSVNTIAKRFSEVSKESTISLDSSSNALNSHEQNQNSITEESPGTNKNLPSESFEPMTKNSVDLFVTTEKIPEDVSEVTSRGKAITNDEDENRAGEGNSRGTKYDNATSGTDSVSTATETVSNSVSASIENGRGDGADFSSKDEDSTFAETNSTYSKTDTVDLTNNSQGFSNYATDSYVPGNFSSGMATESLIDGNDTSATSNDVVTSLMDDKTNEGNGEAKETSVYGIDSVSTTQFENALKEEDNTEMKSVGYSVTTSDLKYVDQTTYSSENSSSDVIGTTLSSWIEDETTGTREMNNSISTSGVISTTPTELKGQQTSGEKVNGFDESTFKSDRVTTTARPTTSGQDVASSSKYPVMNFPDPSLNSVYKIIRHEPDFLNPVVIGPDSNGSYQTGEHKIKKPQIVKKLPPENPFFKFAKISTSSTSSLKRTSRPEVSRDKDQRISLMGSKKRQSFDNDVENQYRWFYKLVGQDSKDSRNEDRKAEDNAKVRCEHGG